MRLISEAFKAVVISIFENSRKKSTLFIIFLSILFIIVGNMISSTYNLLAVILMFSGTIVCLLGYVYRWKDPLWFLILIIISSIGFPLFVILHNAFYAVAEISKDIVIVNSIFGYHRTDSNIAGTLETAGSTIIGIRLIYFPVIKYCGNYA